MDTVIKAFLVISWLAAVYSAPRFPKHTVAEPNQYYYNNIDGDGTPGVYSFGYDVSDPVTGNTQYRAEERYSNGTVTGHYGYIDPYGRPQRFRYVADVQGYRVFPDFPKTQPYVMPHSGDKVTESSVSWTRPPKPHKQKVLHDLVSKLGSLFTKTNLL